MKPTQWVRRPTYSGKLRDSMRQALRARCVQHEHDEVVIEVGGISGKTTVQDALLNYMRGKR